MASVLGTSAAVAPQAPSIRNAGHAQAQASSSRREPQAAHRQTSAWLGPSP